MAVNALLVRSVAAFLLLPGTVAYVVPLIFATGGPERRMNGIGLLPLAAGTVLLLWCVREFYVAGRGTLAPWSPPRELVVTGPYRRSRNPMYVAVLLILAGWSLAFPSRALVIYTCAVAIAFHLRVLFYEEPRLARMFNEQWQAYVSRVPRWMV